MIGKIFTAVLAAAALLPGCSPMTANFGFGSAPAVSTEIADRAIGSNFRSDLLAGVVLNEVNDYRARHDLSPLSIDPVATEAAIWHSSYQARVATMTHSSTVAGMEKFDGRYRKLGGEKIILGVENIAWHQVRSSSGAIGGTYGELADRIVSGWIDSPPHRRNLLSTSTRGRAIAGLGFARGSNRGAEGIYSTLDILHVQPSTASTGG